MRRGSRSLEACSCVPMVSEMVLEELEANAKEFALTKGLCRRAREIFHEDYVEPVRFCLFPTPLQARWCALARKAQIGLNMFLHRMARDNQALFEALKRITAIDPFLRDLYDIHVKVNDDKNAGTASLTILRSTYMMDEKSEKLKLIDWCTMAVSNVGLSTTIHEMQRFIVNKLTPDQADNKPDYDTRRDVVNGLIKAWEYYDNKEAIILLVVEDKATKVGDEKSLEIAVFEQNPGILVKRKRFLDLITETHLDEANVLRVEKAEVAVIYYMTGYKHDDYRFRGAWNVRALLERSKAVKCPSIRHQLAGASRIFFLMQNKIDFIEKFLTDQEHVKTIQGLLGRTLSLAKEEDGDKNIELILHAPQDWILKPQRQNGKDAFRTYANDEMTNKLARIKQQDNRDCYYALERVKPCTSSNFACIPNSSLADNGYGRSQMAAKLDIYGILLSVDQHKILLNSEAGCLIRNKDLFLERSSGTDGASFYTTPFFY
ncbi:glutathione synthetase-like [Brevipalpus obovatus]|uniref:glutathione synthetase-like n=1 Tax=Brevipalpus obovatus TaxID=246614 RepID=UPI003D9DD8DF